MQTVQVSCAKSGNSVFLTYVMCIETGTACGMMSFFVLFYWLTIMLPFRKVADTKTEDTSRQRKNHKLLLSGSVFVSANRSGEGSGMLGRECPCVCAAVDL